MNQEEEVIEDVAASLAGQRAMLFITTSKNRSCTIFADVDSRGTLMENIAIHMIKQNAQQYFTKTKVSYIRWLLRLPCYKQVPRAFSFAELKGLPVSVLDGLSIKGEL